MGDPLAYAHVRRWNQQFCEQHDRALLANTADGEKVIEGLPHLRAGTDEFPGLAQHLFETTLKMTHIGLDIIDDDLWSRLSRFGMAQS